MSATESILLDMTDVYVNVLLFIVKYGVTGGFGAGILGAIFKSKLIRNTGFIIFGISVVLVLIGWFGMPIITWILVQIAKIIGFFSK